MPGVPAAVCAGSARIELRLLGRVGKGGLGFKGFASKLSGPCLCSSRQCRGGKSGARDQAAHVPIATTDRVRRHAATLRILSRCPSGLGRGQG